MICQILIISLSELDLKVKDLLICQKIKKKFLPYQGRIIYMQ